MWGFFKDFSENYKREVQNQTLHQLLCLQIPKSRIYLPEENIRRSALLRILK